MTIQAVFCHPEARDLGTLAFSMHFHGDVSGQIRGLDPEGVKALDGPDAYRYAGKDRLTLA